MEGAVVHLIAAVPLLVGEERGQSVTPHEFMAGVGGSELGGHAGGVDSGLDEDNHFELLRGKVPGRHVPQRTVVVDGVEDVTRPQEGQEGVCLVGH